MKAIERTSAGASELERQARKCQNYYNAGSAWQIICSADTNAADTCREEGIRADSEGYNEFWSNIFWASLESLLSSEPYAHHVKQWFRNRGVNW